MKSTGNSGGWEERMGHHRKGEDRGSVDRPGARNAKYAVARKPPLAPETRAQDHLVAKSFRSPRRRQAGARQAEPQVCVRASSIADQSGATVGHRRLWMVAAVFVVTGLLLGGRAVHISLTEDERLQGLRRRADRWDAPRPSRRPAAASSAPTAGNSLRASRSPVSSPRLTRSKTQGRRQGSCAPCSAQRRTDRGADKGRTHEARC